MTQKKNSTILAKTIHQARIHLSPDGTHKIGEVTLASYNATKKETDFIRCRQTIKNDRMHSWYEAIEKGQFLSVEVDTLGHFQQNLYELNHNPKLNTLTIQLA